MGREIGEAMCSVFVMEVDDGGDEKEVNARMGECIEKKRRKETRRDREGRAGRIAKTRKKNHASRSAPMNGRRGKTTLRCVTGTRGTHGKNGRFYTTTVTTALFPTFMQSCQWSSIASKRDGQRAGASALSSTCYSPHLLLLPFPLSFWASLLVRVKRIGSPLRRMDGVPP